MFRVGQTVWHKNGKHSGKVADSDASVTYFVQANGVEIDFPTRDLTDAPPKVATQAEAIAATLSRVLTMREITPEHQKVLSVIPPRTIQAVALLWEKRPGSGRFSTLNTAQKLNFISEVSGIPYRVMRQYSDQPGNLGLMMAKGLAESGGTGR